MDQDQKQYDSVVAAKYLLALAYHKNIVLNTTKVQKMLFIAYGYFLANYNRVLLSEKPKAWPYGPVFPRTRKKVNYGEVISLDNEELNEISEDENVKSVFNKIIETYSKYSASQLSDWSHMDGSPWDLTSKQPGFNWNQEIPDEFIQQYFAKIDV